MRRAVILATLTCILFAVAGVTVAEEVLSSKRMSIFEEAVNGCR
jgi:hypothetical protein